MLIITDHCFLKDIGWQALQVEQSSFVGPQIMLQDNQILQRLLDPIIFLCICMSYLYRINNIFLVWKVVNSSIE